MFFLSKRLDCGSWNWRISDSEAAPAVHVLLPGLLPLGQTVTSALSGKRFDYSKNNALYNALPTYSLMPRQFFVFLYVNRLIVFRLNHSVICV